MKHPPINQSDDKPLSNRADEPKAKNRKWDPTPDLVVLEDDDSTPLSRKIKGMGKKAHTHNPGKDEGFGALSQCLKGEAQAIQYNLKLAILTEYRNLHIPNLKGPPNPMTTRLTLAMLRMCPGAIQPRETSLPLSNSSRT